MGQLKVLVLHSPIKHLAIVVLKGFDRVSFFLAMQSHNAGLLCITMEERDKEEKTMIVILPLLLSTQQTQQLEEVMMSPKHQPTGGP